MTRDEIVHWSLWACEDSRAQIGPAGMAARDDWVVSINLADELQALRVCGIKRRMTPNLAAEAAANAAVEVAIVCSIWPERLDDVLRPSKAPQQRRLA